MTTYRKKSGMKNSSAASSENATTKALDLFAEMMISKIESINADWSKPWFTSGKGMQYPRNLSGRFYNGMNSMMLLMHCENNGYEYPIFCTFDRVSGLNYTKTSDGIKPVVDADGNKLPMVTVRKGEKSFPVFITTFTCVHGEDGSKIKYEDYKLLSEEDRKEYNVYPKLSVYHVFNISQTNMSEARPELFAKLTADMKVEKPVASEGGFHFEPIDRMIRENLWICPINLTYGDEAYYSISKNAITFPLYEQFKDGESFYSNLCHECAHSTGAENLLNRLKPASFGSKEYAREELIAELTAALVSQYYGIEKHIKDDSAAYLKSWLDSLREDASFIKTVLLDVKRAAGMITFRIDEIAKECAG